MQTLQVKITSPQKDIFEGPATSVSSKNSVGAFDVLVDHANFITLINNEPIIVQKFNGQAETFRFPLAIMHVNNNNLTVYTDVFAAASPEEFISH